MSELSREGHRERAKENFIKNGKTLQDHHLLELLLFYSIPRRDVKPIAYNLINRFGSFENVFNADIESLCEVEGVGENTAVLISLVAAINKRRSENKNNDVKRLTNSKDAAEYAKNILRENKVEKLLLITLDNDLKIIGNHIVSEGSVNTAKINAHKLVSYIIKDNASCVIIAHNHPEGNANPSIEDINFTVEILSVLRSIGIHLNDHIIVGENEVTSMALTPKFKNYFK